MGRHEAAAAGPGRSSLPVRVPAELRNAAEVEVEADSPTRNGEENEQHEDDEQLPGTPPAKRFRSVFLGISQQTLHTSQLCRTSPDNILAEDSDLD